MLHLAPQLARWRKARRLRPLAAWKAWHSDKTSQRELVELLGIHSTVVAFGGNRTGKTEWLRAVVVAVVLGSDHPDARAYWQRHGLDPDIFPKGPGKGAIFARSSNDSINYHRSQIDKLLPGSGSAGPYVKWYNKNGKGEARCLISVPGYDQHAEIVFKSEDQGEDAAQGDSWRISAHDEEGDTDAVWREASVRLWDQSGWQIMANTPVKGKTWVFDRFIEGRPGPNEDPSEEFLKSIGVRWIHGDDNPFLPPKAYAGLSGAEEAIRRRGEFVTREGRIWPGFSRGAHVVEPFKIPDSWPRFRAIDFGFRAPFACLWAALSPDEQIVIYREHYQAEMTLPSHVTAIRLAEGWEWVSGPDETEVLVPLDDAEPVELTWADPENPEQLAELNREHDFGAAPAVRAVRMGIDMVASEFESDGILIFSDCTRTIREVEGYVWAKSIAGREPEKPRKKDDHTCDCVRYLTVGIRLMW